MKQTTMRIFTFAAAAAAMVILSSASRARADVIVTASEVGPNVVFTGGGTLDLTGMSFFATGIGSPSLKPASGALAMGSTSAADDIYTGVTGPGSFGPSSTTTVPSARAGDFFVMGGSLAAIAVPHGYASGSALSATDTYASATFASLGMTPGTYTWNLPHDTFTLQIGAAAVLAPMAASAGLVLIAGLGLCKRRRASGS